MKKLVRSAVAVVLTLSLTAGMASAFGVGTVTASSSLRLRSKASTSSTVLGKAPGGAKVEVLEDAVNGWYKVKYNGTVGYMSADYLSVTPAEVKEEADAAGSKEESAGEAKEEVKVIQGRVTAESLNVRSGAGAGYSRLGKLPAGTLVTVITEGKDWHLVTAKGLKGYVSARYVNIIDPEAAANAATPGEKFAELAKQYLGVPYVYGGTSPSGFDCSGIIYYIAKSMGYSVPRTATNQWNAGYTKVSRSELQPGDLVFFTKTYHSSKYITHVGIYIGDGKFLHASSPTSGGVIVTPMSNSFYSSRFVGGRRIFD